MTADKKTNHPGEGSHDALPHTTQQLEQPRKQSAEILATPDVQPAVETKPEQLSPTEAAFEQYKQVDDTKPDESPYVIRHAHAKSAKPIPTDDGQSKIVTDIEEIMASDLGSAYQTMTPQQQVKFKAKGEEVAKKIAELITHVGFTVKKVLSLIRDWLKMIPKVNTYFLEQEVKIKTDELIKYAKSKHSKLS